MSGRKCYICEKPLDDEETFVIKFDDESFDLCEQHYQTSQKILAHIDKRKKELEGKICCKNYEKGCEYDSAWFCKNPDCLTPVITSTLVGVYPEGCPKIDKWNSKEGEEFEEDLWEHLSDHADTVPELEFIPCDEDNNCSECIKQRQNCDYDDSFKWRYADEALKLIGEDDNNE